MATAGIHTPRLQTSIFRCAKDPPTMYLQKEVGRRVARRRLPQRKVVPHFLDCTSALGKEYNGMEAHASIADDRGPMHPITVIRRP